VPKWNILKPIMWRTRCQYLIFR